MATAATPNHEKPATGQKETDPLARQVAMAIRAQASGRLNDFYGARGYWPMWVHDGALGKEADKLADALESADLDGLNPRRYKADRVREAIAQAESGTPEALARAELTLSEAFARYAIDMRRPAGDVKITYLDAELEPKKQREDDVLRAASMASSLAHYIGGMEWMSQLYATRRAALARYLKAGGKDATEEKRLRLNLDRARLLPGPWTRHVVVDAASARLWYYADGKQQGTMRVVVGEPETPTPMLAGMVRYATLNPYWNVPTDLVQKRIAPKVLKGASLKAMGYEALSDWTANAAVLDPKTIDWQAVADGREELRVRQLPGKTNAMGRVKFMFPNDQGIYLHDTPSRSLFTKTARQFSNGCVRLEDAQRLGRWFFDAPLAAKSKKPEEQRPLPQPVPVYLTYLTAAPTEKGVGFLDDVYGRDGLDGRSGKDGRDGK